MDNNEEHVKKRGPGRPPKSRNKPKEVKQPAPGQGVIRSFFLNHSESLHHDTAQRQGVQNESPSVTAPPTSSSSSQPSSSSIECQAKEKVNRI